MQPVPSALPPFSRYRQPIEPEPLAAQAPSHRAIGRPLPIAATP